MAYSLPTGMLPPPGAMPMQHGLIPGAPQPFPIHAQHGLIPVPMHHPLHVMPTGPVHFPLQPPLGLQMSGHTIAAPPLTRVVDPEAARVPTLSLADTKVATTVFVGNISEKATDTLVRQILLRCGYIVGWKRVQGASGKLQAFGFCEFSNPESTLRALRLLDGYRLGDKDLVVKVDSKTRKDLLKYIVSKRRTKEGATMDEREIEKEVAKLEEKDCTQYLKEEPDNDAKTEDKEVLVGISGLVKENIEVLGGKTSAEVQLEQDVRESLLSMAKQSGKVDPDTGLEDMEMEEDMKTLVSDEIKKFRLSYQRSEEEKVKKARERVREKEEREKANKDKVPKEPPTDTANHVKGGGDDHRPPSPKHSRERSRSRTPPKKTKSSPPPDHSRSPTRPSSHAKSTDRAERLKAKEAERVKEKEESARDEEEYEQRLQARKQREREKAYKERLQGWENREYRRVKEYEKDVEREEQRREEMERERKHLAEFLEDYDDVKDDQRYYKGNAYARRHREREMEMDEDEKDRQKEKDELETLKIQVLERQHKQLLDEEEERKRREAGPAGKPGKEEDADMFMPSKDDMDEDIPLAKTTYTGGSLYPFQIQSAPSVNTPELKESPHDPTDIEFSTSKSFEPLSLEEVKREADGSSSSPHSGPKLAFGFGRKSSLASVSSSVPPEKKAKLETVFNPDEDEGLGSKPKIKLVPIEYTEEEQQAVGRTNKIPKEEKNKMVQNLVNSIPTVKEELFAYELKWETIDKTMMEKRVSPWIKKKIVEYIGEEEPTLVDFICNKLACHIAPQSILSDISMVLDEEAETFIMKLWRLLIYETEAKHLGISKFY